MQRAAMKSRMASALANGPRALPTASAARFAEPGIALTEREVALLNIGGIFGLRAIQIFGSGVGYIGIDLESRSGPQAASQRAVEAQRQQVEATSSDRGFGCRRDRAENRHSAFERMRSRWVFARARFAFFGSVYRVTPAGATLSASRRVPPIGGFCQLPAEYSPNVRPRQ